MSWNEPGGDNKDPWSGRGDDKKPPDLDEVIRSLQEKLTKIFGGGGGDEGGSNNSSGNTFSNSPMKGLGLAIGAGILLAIWGVSGFYIVDEGNNGIETRFGQYTVTTQSGLNWHLPAPIGRHDIVNVKQQRFIEVGYRSVAGTSEQGSGSVPKEALMLTADENIVDVSLNVRYQVDNAKDFLFNVANPAATLKQVTESVQRGVVGSNTMDFILTEGRSEIVTKIKAEIQEVMNSYHAGIIVTEVNLQDAQPPEEVQNAFVDAIKSREDKERLINEAQAYYNDVVPKARGAAARKKQEAEGYKEQVIAQATGEVSRFSQLLAEYQKAPEVTRKRMYIEAMESVLSETNTVMVDVKNGANNMLYLPLDKMLQQQPAVSGNTSQSTAEPVASPTPKPIVAEKQPASIDRSAARGRDLRGRSDAE
ncbi:MAG: FtsH protease activity modulator HflK [Methylococcales bacterium]|nr:FtsH protease activity modulator HflK [Methylococcales bacterium]MDP3837716.1 FtsH protease activity modulator HflK [Methylococcales bacterium]